MSTWTAHPVCTTKQPWHDGHASKCEDVRSSVIADDDESTTLKLYTLTVIGRMPSVVVGGEQRVTRATMTAKAYIAN